jgi:hypothetical protein
MREEGVGDRADSFDGGGRGGCGLCRPRNVESRCYLMSMLGVLTP